MSSSSYDFSVDTSPYEPSPMFNTHTVHEPANWYMWSYYLWSLLFSCIAIVTSVGTWVTRGQCTAWAGDDPNSNSIANGFWAFAIITFIFAVILFVMSLIALITKTGFREQWAFAAEKVFKPDQFARAVRIKELQRQSSSLLSDVGPTGTSSLASEIEMSAANPYSDMTMTPA